MTELLAPAGDMLCLDAALSAGADAVYLAGKSFGARAFAGNFEKDELLSAYEKAAFLGKRLYVTLNTLLTDRELESALEFARFLYESPACHGVIVQDLGLARLLKENFPALSLHGSTQMCIHSAAGVELCGKMGFDRVVIARESTEKEIEACVKTGVETEVFIHGAHCVSQSGGCLMSSFIGKRSGNRGACAQPCRLPYSEGYSLSMKDMCLADHIPQLVKMGVASLKIEGRMKSPAYVYGVTSIYRRLIDESRTPEAEETQALRDLFSRSGFSDGYYTGKTGTEMFGVRSQADKDTTREQKLSVPQIPDKKVDIYGDFNKDQCTLTATCEGKSFTVTATALPASGKGTEKTVFEDAVKKCGGSGFTCDQLYIGAEEGIFMPVSAIKGMRRQVLEGLKNEIIKENGPQKSKRRFFVPPLSLKQRYLKGDVYRIYDIKCGFVAPKDAARVDIPLWQLDKAKEYGAKNLSAVLPRVITTAQEPEIQAMLEKAKAQGIGSVTVSNLGHLPLCKGFAVYADANLNVTNSVTARTLKEMGLSSVCVSPEVHPKAVETDIGEYAVYGKQPVMHTENCIIKNVQGCSSSCDCMLIDRTGAKFPIKREYGHRNLIFNSVPTYLVDKSVSHNRLFMITDEKTVPDQRPKEFTRAYYK